MMSSRRGLRSLAVAVLVLLSACALPERAKAAYEYEAYYYSYYAYLYSYYAAVYEDAYPNDSSHYLGNLYCRYAYEYASTGYSQSDDTSLYYGFIYGFEAAMWNYRAYYLAATSGGSASYSLYAWEASISTYSHCYVALQ